MSTVYVVQEPLRRNPRTKKMEPFMNFTPAAAYGDIEILLGYNMTLTPAPMVHELRKKLKNFSDNDYLLPVGDPVAMAAACAIALQMNRGVVNILKWNRDTSSYIKIKLEV